MLCTAAEMPRSSDGDRTFTVRLRPGIYFQDDPAFKGQRREMVAADCVYQFKRVFDPRFKSPHYADCRTPSRWAGSAAHRSAENRRRVRLRPAGRRHPRAGSLRVRGAAGRAESALHLQLHRSPTTSVRWRARLWSPSYETELQGRPVGTGPFRLAQTGGAPRASCWNAAPRIAKSFTRPRRRPMTSAGSRPRSNWLASECP